MNNMNNMNSMNMVNQIISEKALIGQNVQMGYNVIIEEDVVIGDNCILGHNVIIRAGVRLGKGVLVGDGVLLGKLPMKASLSAVTTAGRVLPPLEVGDSVTLGAGSMVYRGAVLKDRVFVADCATIREDVTIGEETIIGRGVAVENKTSIGRRCKIETNAYITALSEIEDYCFVAPEVAFTNDNFMGRTEERKKHFKGPVLRQGARIGGNATLLPGIEIGPDGVVAAGSVVTKDVPPRTIVAGNPARILREVPPEQLLENQVFYEPHAKS